MKKHFKKILIGLGLLGIAYGASLLPIEQPVITPVSIESQLVGKTAKEKANIKAKEIAKLDFTGVYTDSATGITVEIKDGKVNQVGDHLELYARAWKGTKQLGFGKDGTIEWERFIRTIKVGGKHDNLTYLVITDPLGDISVDYPRKDIKTGIVSTTTIKYKYDPIAVLQKMLADDIRIVGKEGTNIVKGSIGNTTTTVYPQAGEGGANVTTDAYVGPNAQDVSWATIRSSATGSITDGVNATNPFISIYNSATTNQWYRLFRSILTFDTSGIPDTDDISSAVLSLKGTSKADNIQITPDIDVYTATPAANNIVAAADFLNVGSTSQTGSPITYANWSTTAYNDFTFNATGRGNISKTGVSPFAMRNANYDASGTAPTWLDSTVRDSYLVGSYADTADVTSDPKLVIEHAATAVAPVISPIILFE